MLSLDCERLVTVAFEKGFANLRESATMASRTAPQKYKVRGLSDAYCPLNEAAAPRLYDSMRIKVLYHAAEEALESKAVDNCVPFPVVVFLGGAFVESNRYQWLGEKLVEDAGIAVVTTEGLSLFHETRVLAPFGGNAMAADWRNLAISSLMKRLEDFNGSGVLEGKLDLSTVILIGHSLGGSIALESVDGESFPNIKAVCTYGAHLCRRPQSDGSAAGGLPVQCKAPLLLLGGSADGVMMQSCTGKGSEWSTPEEPIRRTYDEAVTGNRPATYVVFDGFNHFAIVDPIDRTLGTGYLDFDSKVPKSAVKDELSTVISLFVREHAFDDKEAAQELKKHLQDMDNPYVKAVEFGP